MKMYCQLFSIGQGIPTTCWYFQREETNIPYLEILRFVNIPALSFYFELLSRLIWRLVKMSV